MKAGVGSLGQQIGRPRVPGAGHANGSETSDSMDNYVRPLMMIR